MGQSKTMNLDKHQYKALHTIVQIFRAMIIVILVLVLGIVIYCWTHISENLAVTHYSIRVGLNEPIRIVQLSDLHNEEFGAHNCDLINLVEEQHPDIIVMTGDMITTLTRISA